MKKHDIDNIEVPDELEERLRGALEKSERKPEKRNWLIRHKLIAALLAFVLFLGAANHNALAYYGKKILGYNQVTYGSIKELNEQGMGQEINKTYTFKNGTTVTLNGAMLDENKLIIMYKIKGNGIEASEIASEYSSTEIKGRLKSYSSISGYGQSSNDKKEISYIQEYKSPSLFETTLTFELQSTSKDASNGEIGKITFNLDRNKAIKGTFKSTIMKSVVSEGIEYKFTTMTATPLSVVIQGNVTDDKAGAIFNREGLKKQLDIELTETYIKDGKAVTENIPLKDFGTSSDLSGIKFKYEFDGLKSGLKSLTLNVVKTEDKKLVDKTIAVKDGTNNISVIQNSEELIIKNVKINGNKTYVTFNTPKDVAFDTALFIGDKQIQTLSSSINKIKVNGKDVNEKVYCFDGSGDTMKLMFKEISHEQYINQGINLYTEK